MPIHKYRTYLDIEGHIYNVEVSYTLTEDERIEIAEAFIEDYSGDKADFPYLEAIEEILIARVKESL